MLGVDRDAQPETSYDGVLYDGVRVAGSGVDCEHVQGVGGQALEVVQHRVANADPGARSCASVVHVERHGPGPLNHPQRVQFFPVDGHRSRNPPRGRERRLVTSGAGNGIGTLRAAGARKARPFVVAAPRVAMGIISMAEALPTNALPPEGQQQQQHTWHRQHPRGRCRPLDVLLHV